MAVPVERRARLRVHGFLAAAFALVFVVLNVMLSRMIVQPISGMAMAAEQTARNFENPEFAEGGTRSRSWPGLQPDAPEPQLALEMIDGQATGGCGPPVRKLHAPSSSRTS
jgi:hypothetical protein